MDIENEYQPRIQKGVERSIKKFNKEVLKKNPELLTKTTNELFKEWKPDPDMELIEDVYQMLFRGWLLGMSHSSRTGRDDYADISIDFGLTFQEAIEAAGGRISLTPAQFQKLSDDLKLHAFTIGRLTQLDMIGKVKDAYVRQLRSSSLSLDEFLKDVYEIDADQAGFGGYYTTVFRTNLQKDYNAGKAYQMMQDPPMYLEFIGIDDSRQSEICAARTGVIRPYTDPWWDDNWPPLHYNCRSTVREIFPEEAKARGLEPTSIPNIVEKDTKGDNGKVVRRNVPTSGFGRRPAIDNAFWGTSISQQQRVAGYMIQDEINGVAGKTICKDFSLDKPGFTKVSTAKGGLRYDKRITAQELANNLEVARPLAEIDGYYVELRSNEYLKNNRQADAWLNGVDKVEFKNLTSRHTETFAKELDKAKTQASTIAVRLKYNGQVKPLAKYLAANGHGLAIQDAVKEIIVILGDRIVHVLRNDLVSLDLEAMTAKLSALYPPRNPDMTH